MVSRSTVRSIRRIIRSISRFRSSIRRAVRRIIRSISRFRSSMRRIGPTERRPPMFGGGRPRAGVCVGNRLLNCYRSPVAFARRVERGEEGNMVSRRVGVACCRSGSRVCVFGSPNETEEPLVVIGSNTPLLGSRRVGGVTDNGLA